MYPFGLKERKKIHFLINVPFGHFSLAMYPFGLKEKNAERVRGARRGPGPYPRTLSLIFLLRVDLVP